MNTRRICIGWLVMVMLFSGCAPAARGPATPVAVSPREQVQATPQSGKPLPPQPTRAPEATKAPEATRSAELNRAGATSAAATPAVGSAWPPYMPLPQGQAGAPYGYPAPLGPDNQFQDYGTNPYIDSRRDHLSTFGLDVDTASYTVIRRYLTDGSLPPPEAVRPEEVINFFDAGYNPPSTAAFALYAEGAPSPFSADGTYILRFGVQGYRVPESRRDPVSLTFVIDVSGSMNLENRLGLVKRSLQVLVERLRPQDSVGVVVFGTTARSVLPATPLTRKDQILNAINSLRTEGSTNADAGLRLGYQQAMQSFRPNTTNKVILCSDGVANTGQTHPDAMLAYVQGFIKEGISLNTYGFGMGNFNDVLLERLADRGDGMYAYIDTLDEAYRLFVDTLTGSLQTIALDAKTQVDFNPDVVRYYRLIGYENRAVADQDFRNDAVDAGEIGAGHHAVALYAVYLQPNARGRVATVQLRWLDPKTRQATEINGNLNTWDLKGSFEEMEGHYQLAVVAAQFAEILKGTPWAQEMDLWQVVQLAAGLRERLPMDTYLGEFVDLVNRAATLKQGNRQY